MMIKMTRAESEGIDSQIDAFAASLQSFLQLGGSMLPDCLMISNGSVRYDARAMELLTFQNNFAVFLPDFSICWSFMDDSFYKRSLITLMMINA